MASRSYNNNENTDGGLYWPYNLTDNFDYLQMDISDFVPRSQRSSPDVSATPTTSSSPTPVGSDFNVWGGAFIDFGTQSIPGLDLGGRQFTATGNILEKSGSILLPIPEEVSYKDNPQWSDQAVGVMGRFGPQVAKQFMEGDTTGITKAVTDMADAGKVGVLLDMIKKLQADPNAITQNINGKIANPYVEQVFGGLGMRQFDFSWKLAPRNRKEQASIKKIIKTIREAALPNKTNNFGDVSGVAVGGADGGGEGNERWLTVPKVFQLSWRHKGVLIESMPKFKLCVCKDIQVQYTPDNVWASHMFTENQPYPVAYNLTLSFGETEIITRDLVQQGY
mgnify:CR=1 FL=1